MDNNTQTVEELIPIVKAGIIKQLNIDMTPDALDEDMALFGEGLGLDSIDALELIVLIDRDFGIKIGDPKEARKIFQSVRVMAEYIQENREK
ncbi:MAG TPA: phosphopantetheine-binding protein [Flavitalea sp.]|nr:phosphopantetheine-binding protein [Flavitalea sp.]